MTYRFTNKEIATMLRNMKAAYEILGENRFKIIAYEKAKDVIESLTSEVSDYYESGTLDRIPGIGKTLIGHIKELFMTGAVEHFTHTFHKIPEAVFPLLSISGIGAKKSFAIVRALHFFSKEHAIDDLERACKAHKVSSIDGFGERSEQQILRNIEHYKKGHTKDNRILLDQADAIAHDIMTFLQDRCVVEKIEVLGSIRRRSATVGDIDIAVMTPQTQKVLDTFCTYPYSTIIEKGPSGASIRLSNGRQADVRICKKDEWGSMIQYFTGSKYHNIALREYALSQGLSLSEYGFKSRIQKDQKKNSLRYQPKSSICCRSEKEIYTSLGLQWMPPELREDRGEIAASMNGTLPLLVTHSDIKGDLHIHTSYELSSSHDTGADSLEVLLDTSRRLGYEYIGISDHNPKYSELSERQILTIMEKRKNYYEQIYYSYIKSIQKEYKKYPKIFIMLEIDIRPDGTLAFPDSCFDFLDAAIISIHSSFQMAKKQMTERICTAMTRHPKIRILGHPTGRMLLKRRGIDADWDVIMSVAKQQDIALEINANTLRLDLPDTLIKQAKKHGTLLCVNTDAHWKGGLNDMRYGVDTARRGWATKDDIVNTLPYNAFRSWLTGSRMRSEAT